MKKLLAILSAVALLVAQPSFAATDSLMLLGVGVGVGGGGGGPTLVGTVTGASTGGAGAGFTTSGISLSATATITWIALSWCAACSVEPIATASNSATITCLGAAASTVGGIDQCYTINSIPSGTTFTLTGVGSFGALCIAGFTGLTAYDSPNKSSAAATAPASLQPGSVTPTSGSTNAAITVTDLVDNSGASPPTISAGYTIDATSLVNTGVSIGCSIAHKFNVSGAENPTWTYNATPLDAGAAIAISKP